MFKTFDYQTPQPMEFWQERFNEANWPLAGTLRSYLLYQIHGRISHYSRRRDNPEERKLMLGWFSRFRVTLEKLEAEAPVSKRVEKMFQELEADYAGDYPEGYLEFKEVVLHILAHMEEAERRVDWGSEQVHQNFLLILDAQDQDAPDGDLELRAELNDSEELIRDMLWELKLARDAVLWSGTKAAREAYLSIAREILVENGAYEEFRRQYTPHEDPGIFAKLRASVDELEVTLEVHELWTEHTT